MKTVIYNVFLAIALSKTTEGTLMKNPMGIKMCERECHYLKGCYAIRYETVSPQCTPLTDPKDAAITKTVPSSKDPSCLLLTYSEGGRSAMNKHHQPVSDSSEESSLVVKNTSLWLLVVPYYDEITSAFKMDLITKELQPLLFFWKHVIAFLPVPREEKYLIAFVKGIISSPMNRPRYTQIFKTWTTYLMRLDGKRRLVFCSFEWGGRQGIARMSTNGRRKRGLLIVRHDVRLTMMDIDPDQQKVYFMTERGLIRINYDGKDVNVETSGYGGITGVLYNPSKGELYIHNHDTGELMRATRRNNMPVRIAKGKIEIIRSAALYADVLYFAEEGEDEISSVRIDEKYPTLVKYPFPKTAANNGWLLDILPAGQ